MRWLRRVVFGILGVAYLFTCPAVVFYALGYSLAPRSEQALIRTGLISITTIPSGASVYLGNRRYTRKTPTVLRDLVPGDYDVRLVLKSHEPWQAGVNVRPSRATALHRVRLIPQSWNPIVVSGEAFDNLVPIPGLDILLLRAGTRLGGVTVYDARVQDGWPLLPASSALGDARVLNQIVMPGSGEALFRVQDQDHERWLWIDVRDRKKELHLDIGNLLLTRPQRFFWDALDHQKLYTFRAGTISRLDAEAGMVLPALAEKVRGYGVYNRKLYIVHEDGSLTRLDPERKTEDVLNVRDPLSRFLAEENGRVQVHVLNDNMLLGDRLILLVGEKGQVWANRFPYLLVDEGVVGVDTAPRAGRLLLWKRSQLGVLETDLHSDAETGHSQLSDVRWADCGAQNIHQVFWVDDGTHVLVHDQDRALFVRLPSPGFARVRVDEVARLKPETGLAYCAVTGKLYFIDRDTSRLTSIEILPRRELLSLPFAENRSESAKEKSVPR